MAATSWIVDLPFARPLTLNQRMHHMARHRLVAQYRKDAGWKLRAARIPRCRRVRITLIFTPPDRRVRDEDNLVATLKVVKDALVDAGIVVDDSGEYVEALMPVLDPPHPGHPRLRLFIERLA